MGLVLFSMGKLRRVFVFLSVLESTPYPRIVKPLAIIGVFASSVISRILMPSIDTLSLQHTDEHSMRELSGAPANWLRLRTGLSRS